MILVDSCVVIDVLENDRKWADWSQTQLENWRARRRRRLPAAHARPAALRRLLSVSGPGHA